MKDGTNSAPAKRRVLIVDDHPRLRDGLAKLINRQHDLICCGEADSVRSAQEAVAGHKPDLLLLDLRLGDADVLELIKVLKAQYPHLVILVISQYDDTLWPERALRAGALGYVVKQEATEEVLGAIRAVLGGNLYVSRSVAGLLVQKFIQNKPEVPRSGVESLTDRELQVLRLIGLGWSTREIAGELTLSFKTVESHRENIKHKLGLRDAAHLASHANEWVQSRPRTSHPHPRSHGAIRG